MVFLFLNSWRSTVITGLALPVSVLASFVAVWAFGFTLNTMSLLGLSLAIGILIDDAIVVRENIVRHVEMGKDHYTAAHDGTDEIGLAVAATTFSIVVVFVPIAFMGGIAGQWFKPFALTIACVGAGVAVRVVLARPDAVGLLARPARAAWSSAGSSRGCSTSFNAWFDRQAERLQERDRAGRSTTASRWWRSRSLSFVGALALPALGFVGGGVLPDDGRFEFIDRRSRRRRDRTSQYTRLKARRSRRASRGASPRWPTPTRRSAARPATVDEGQIYVTPDAEGRSAIVQPGRWSRTTCAEELSRLGGVHRVDLEQRLRRRREADSAAGRAARMRRELQQRRRAAARRS